MLAERLVGAGLVRLGTGCYEWKTDPLICGGLLGAGSARRPVAECAAGFNVVAMSGMCFATAGMTGPFTDLVESGHRLCWIGVRWVGRLRAGRNQTEKHNAPC